MAKRQRQSELRGCLGGLGYEERRALWGGYVCMCVCVMSLNVVDKKMSTGGHFKHIIITFYHASAS